MKPLKLHLSTNFKKDSKKLIKQDLVHTKELKRLCNGERLEAKYRDHALKGNLQGLRDCHIKPDLVLIYRKDNELLELIAMRIGKHSEIF